MSKTVEVSAVKQPKQLKDYIDENMPSLYREQLLRHLPKLIVRMVGDSGVPPRGTLS
jgi:hypothetical protein